VAGCDRWSVIAVPSVGARPRAGRERKVEPKVLPGSRIDRGPTSGIRAGTVARIARPLDEPIVPASSLACAWTRFGETGASLLPVVGARGEYAGVVRRSTLLRLAQRNGEGPGTSTVGRSEPAASSLPIRSAPGTIPAELGDRRVGEILEQFPFVVERGTSLAMAKGLMDEAGASCLPVLDGIRVVGFVTGADLFRALLETDEASVD
jgi:CBS-domain-containing membrane protein